MKSRLLYVIKNKGQYEKNERRQRKIEVDNLRREGLFRVALNNQLSIIQACLDDPRVTGVEVEVSEESLIDFGRSFGYEEMKDFQIRQVGAANKFKFRRKEVPL